MLALGEELADYQTKVAFRGCRASVLILIIGIFGAEGPQGHLLSGGVSAPVHRGGCGLF